jgi:hypothetical protein
MSIVFRLQPGAFGPETIAAMVQVLEAASIGLQDTSQSQLAREVIARRILAAASFGECDPDRLLEAALSKARAAGAHG